MQTAEDSRHRAGRNRKEVPHTVSTQSDKATAEALVVAMTDVVNNIRQNSLRKQPLLELWGSEWGWPLYQFKSMIQTCVT